MVYKYGGVTYYLKAHLESSQFPYQEEELIVPFGKILNSQLQGWSHFVSGPYEPK
jgi:hypothetical protein